MIILLLIFSSFSFLPYFHSNRVLFLIINLLIINYLQELKINHRACFKISYPFL